MIKTPILRRAAWVLAFQTAGTILSALCSGCATQGYLGDRAKDAADIFTATVGYGYGVKAQAGPIAAGLSWMIDEKGLRGGVISKFPRGDAGWGVIDANVIVGGYQDFCVMTNYAGRYGAENFETLEPRHKCYYAPCILGITVPLPQREDPWSRGHLYRLTQIEVAVGLGYSFRFGFNPGELLDFILGWTTLDIYDDDSGAKKQKAPSNNPAHATARTLAAPDR